MSTEKPIQRYDPDQEWITNGMYEWPDGDYVLFSDHEKALTTERDLLFGVVTERNELQVKLAEEYGRGVTAGKKEALHYSPSEREYYGKHVAQNDYWKDLKNQLSEVADERDRLARWKTEAITVESWWNEVDAEVRKHPETLLGQYVAAAALQLIRERDEFKKLAEESVALNTELAELRCRGAVVS